MGDKTTSVQPARKSFSIELIGLLMGDAIGPKKQSNKLPVVLNYMGGTIHLEAYENQRPCAVAHPARPRDGPEDIYVPSKASNKIVGKITW
jgi:hypothetical protein